MIKTLNKLGIEVNYHNIRKGMLYIKNPKLTPLDGEGKAFPLKPGRRQGCLLSPLYSR